jgi:CheY-like chemotaxis protein
METRTGGKRVLLVDDQAAVREAVGWGLESLGVEVTTAQNGAEALEQFRRGSFDLVITDYSMPGMRGDALAREIKRISPGQRVVLLTAYAGDLLVQGKLPAEIDVLMEKPCSRSDLASALPWR